jgi:hypothetical protein
MLRDRVAEALNLVCVIHEQALAASPDERLANVAGANHGLLRQAIVEAQAIWNNTPIARFLDRPEGPVYLNPEGRQRLGEASGSCYHDLALGVAVCTLKGILDGLTARDFTRMMRFRTAAGDHVTQHISSLISHVRCECQRGIERFSAEKRGRAVAQDGASDDDSLAPEPAGDEAGTGGAEGGGRTSGQGGAGPPKKRTTKKLLEASRKETDKLKLQVYTYIVEQHTSGKKPAAILAALKADRDRKDQVAKAGLTLDRSMVRAALNRLGQRERDARKKQESTPV